MVQKLCEALNLGVETLEEYSKPEAYLDAFSSRYPYYRSSDLILDKGQKAKTALEKIKKLIEEIRK